MTLRIANIDFDQVSYDADADVLYLSAGDPARAVEFDETPEGHAVRFSIDGALVGITIVNARALIEAQGDIRITLPETISAADIAPALASA